MSQSPRAFDQSAARPLHSENVSSPALAVHDVQDNANPHLQSVFDAVTIGIGICTPDRRIAQVNPALLTLLGYSREELVGKRFVDFTHPDDAATNETLFDDVTGGTHHRGETEQRYLRKDGSVLWARMQVSRVLPQADATASVIAIVEDVTDHKRTLQQLVEAQKMEAIGHLVGGVAHDFNNLLTGILLCCDLLLGATPPNDRRRRHADEIRMAAEQGAALVQQLLTVSRRKPVEPRLLSLNDTVRGIWRLLTRLIGEQIELKLDLDPALWRVRLDPVHAQQIILNLVINARDAMPRGGRIVLSAHNCSAKGQSTDRRLVSLAVEDDGCGMDQETQRHLFEPFFTTKQPGQGNGLGLATVYRIVQDGHGTILVESESGKGTRIEIVLPGVIENVLPGPPADIQDRTGSETDFCAEVQ